MTDAKRKPTARQSICIALLVLLAFSLGCSEFIVIGVEPELAASFGVSLARVGEFVSLFAFVYAIGTPALALSTGRFKRYTLLIAYCAVFCIANGVCAVAPTFEVMLAARLAIGLVSGALLAVGVTFIPEFVGPERTPIVISIVYAAFSVAMVFVTSIGKMVAATWHYSYAFIGVFVLAVAVSAALVALMPKQGATDDPATVRDQLPLLLDARILCGMAIFIFGVGSVYVFYAYITPYLEDILGMSAGGAATTLMVYGCVCLVSNFLSGWTASRFGMPALVPVFIAQAGFLFWLFSAGANLELALAAIMFIALSMYVVSTPCITLFMAVARNEYPKALTLAASIEPMAFNIGIAFGTAVGGAVVSGPGMPYVGAVGSVFSLVALLLVLLTMHISKRKRAQRLAARNR